MPLVVPFYLPSAISPPFAGRAWPTWFGILYTAMLRRFITNVPMFFPLGDNRGDVPVRATSFALADRTLFWPRVCLYSDRLVLTGWYFWGRYHRSISLDRVEQTEADGQTKTRRMTVVR